MSKPAARAARSTMAWKPRFENGAPRSLTNTKGCYCDALVGNTDDKVGLTVDVARGWIHSDKVRPGLAGAARVV
jgi:hypothetical protein